MYSLGVIGDTEEKQQPRQSFNTRPLKYSIVGTVQT